MSADKLSESFAAWAEKRRDEVSHAADNISHKLVNLNITGEQQISVSADLAQNLAHLLRHFPRLMESMARNLAEVPEDVENDFDGVEHLVIQLTRSINNEMDHHGA